MGGKEEEREIRRQPGKAGKAAHSAGGGAVHCSSLCIAEVAEVQLEVLERILLEEVGKLGEGSAAPSAERVTLPI